jgi:hypothetical protein
MLVVQSACHRVTLHAHLCVCLAGTHNPAVPKSKRLLSNNQSNLLVSRHLLIPLVTYCTNSTQALLHHVIMISQRTLTLATCRFTSQDMVVMDS